VNFALQLSCVLMDYSPSVFIDEKLKEGSSEATGELPATEPNVKPGVATGTTTESNGHKPRKEADDDGSIRNVFRMMVAGINKDSEIDYLFNGFVRLLSTVPASRSTILPNGVVALPFFQELLILLWHLCTTNQTFLRRITSRLNSNKLLVPLLFMLLDASNSRNDAHSSGPAKIGLLHMCSFLLLALSSEREFAVRLNESFTEKFPLDIPLFRGCHADLLVLIIHRVVIDSIAVAANDSLVDMLLTVMCNVSPYVKSFCLESCVKLLHMLDRFSRPAWLFKMPYHYHDVFFLLDMCNNLIQYQYEGNQRLVYSILRQKDLFLELQNLQFPEKLLRRNSDGGSDESTERIETPAAQTMRLEEKQTLASEAETGDDVLMKEPTNADGKGDTWHPTLEWFNDWKSKLPLQTITRLIRSLLPLVEAECQEKGLLDQSDVMEYLQKTTMVGLLPVPHPIIIRNYQSNVYTSLWFTSYMWGVIFSRSQSLAFFDWRRVRLIVIHSR